MNYLEEEASWLSEHTERVVKVLEGPAEDNWSSYLRPTRARYPNLVIASWGANRKDKPNEEISARVLFVGTNGLQVNTRTRLREQERSPIAADLERALREKATLVVRTFALTADVKEAHRQVPIHPRDWHLLGCRVEAGADVYINTVGTFGVASASYYWSRVSSALGRLSQYLTADSAHTWHMVVADDYHLEAGGEHYRFALFAFFLCCTCGVPLSWNKMEGGETVVSVEFGLLHSTYHLGISQRRAEWFTKWAREVADSDQVHMVRFEEGLGRIMFVVGALELERPFLGPLYRFMSLHPWSSVRSFPPYGRLFLRYLADRVSGSRHYNCAVSMESTTVAPRVDEQASSERAGIRELVPAARTGWQDRC